MHCTVISTHTHVHISQHFLDEMDMGKILTLEGLLSTQLYVEVVCAMCMHLTSTIIDAKPQLLAMPQYAKIRS